MSGFYNGNNAATTVAATTPFGAQPTTSRPPMPAPPGYPQGSPYGGMYQVSPQQLWAQLGFMGEPTLVEIIRDINKAGNDSARFAVGGGFLALSQIIQQVMDYRLTQFFTNFRIELHQMPDGSGAMFLKPAAEQPTDEGRRLQTLTENDLTAQIENIKGAINSNLLAEADAKIDLHSEAARLAAQQGLLGGLLEDSAGGKPGLVSGAAGIVGGVLRSAAGLPPAPKPPGTQ